MSQGGYKQFFKAARESRKTAGEAQFVLKKSTPPKAGASKRKSGVTEEELRAAFNLKPRKATARKFPPLTMCLGLIVAFGLAGFGYSQPEKVEELLAYLDLPISISAMASASAADEKPADTSAKTNGTKGATDAKTAETGEKSNGSACPDTSALREEDLSHFSRLSERKRELDLREQELNALEEELHKQRKEVEERIQKLESVRAEISTVLKDRVEVDQQRVNTLVEFYSNMKPKQAADIFANLNEDLAVEVLGKMKKKNAAEIMNLLPAEKARTLSEKFTGYKRR